jgi:hypothetical protein
MFDVGHELELAPGTDAASVAATGKSLHHPRTAEIPGSRSGALGYGACAFAPVFVLGRLWGAIAAGPSSPRA